MLWLIYYSLFRLGLAMGRDGTRFTNPNPVSYMQVGWKNILIPSLYFFWDKNMSQSLPKRDGILQDPIPIWKIYILNQQWDGMGWNLTIPLPSRVCNWDKKNVSLPSLNFFMGQKYVTIPSQMGWDPAGSHPIGKNCHP